MKRFGRPRVNSGIGNRPGWEHWLGREHRYTSERIHRVTEREGSSCATGDAKDCSKEPSFKTCSECIQAKYPECATAADLDGFKDVCQSSVDGVAFADALLSCPD